MKTRIPTIACASLFAAAGLVLPAQSALIGHYTFDSDFADSAASRDGVANGNASIDNTNFAPDPNGSTGSLNLTNGGYVALPSTDTGTYDEYTISMWVKINGQNDFLGGIYTSDAFNPGALHINHNSQPEAPIIEASIGGFGTPTYEVGDAPVDWLHLALVHQTVGGGTQMWINGVEEATANTGGPTRILDASQIGDWAGQDRQFDGWIDDVRIYDEVLTEEQIVALVPEPTSLALLGLGGLLVTRRRR